MAGKEGIRYAQGDRLRHAADRADGGGIIRGNGTAYDADGRPAGLDLSTDMLRMLVWNDRAGAYENLNASPAGGGENKS